MSIASQTQLDVADDFTELIDILESNQHLIDKVEGVNKPYLIKNSIKIVL